MRAGYGCITLPINLRAWHYPNIRAPIDLAMCSVRRTEPRTAKTRSTNAITTSNAASSGASIISSLKSLTCSGGEKLRAEMETVYPCNRTAFLPRCSSTNLALVAKFLLRHLHTTPKPSLGRCPLLAQSGHPWLHRTCPLLGVKRTCRGHHRMSADPKRTDALQGLLGLKINRWQIWAGLGQRASLGPPQSLLLPHFPSCASCLVR